MNPEDFILPDYPSQQSQSQTSRKRGRSPSQDPFDLNSQSQSQPIIHQEEDRSNQLWYEKYTPTTMAELGIANKKIEGIKKDILNSAIYGKRIKILLLTGPAGIGKSTLVQILCKELGLEITEWLTSKRLSWDDARYVRPIDEFREFINKCIYFRSFGQKNTGRVILLDDMPDLTTEDVKQTFHQILLNCLEIVRPFLIVMVVSDSVTDLDTNKSYEKKTNYVNDVLPQDLKESDTRIKEVKINTITNPQMKKILKEIARKECLFLPASKLEEFVDESDGDIRLAINSLQFRSIPIDDTFVEEKPPPAPVRRAKKDGAKIVEFDDHVGHLSLFHAVGKVLYAKRDAHGNYESTPEHIINKIPVDNDTFIGYVHQNCVGFFNDIEDLAKAFTELADADTLRSDVDFSEKYASIYRNYISSHGIMKNRHGDVGGEMKQLQAQLFKKDYELKRLPQKANHDAWLESIRVRMNEFEVENPNLYVNMRDLDPVENFSSDEDVFDDIFGDGSELADLDI